MAIVVVQAASNSNNSSSNSDLVATFAVNITAGNAIIVWAQSAASSTPAYVGGTTIDGPGDTFTLLKQVNDTVNGQYGGLWFANTSAGGSATVTCKFSGIAAGSGFSSMTVFEVSGLSASASDIGTSNVVAGGSGSSSANGDTSGSFTASVTGELIVAGFFSDSSNTAESWTAGTTPIAFTIPTNGQTHLGTANPHAMEYAVWTGSGAVNPTATLTTTDGYIAIGWGFKPAAAAAFQPDEDKWTQGLNVQPDTNIILWQ